MKVLTLATSTFDRFNTFHITNLPYSVCSLHSGYQKVGDGVVWAMLHSSVLANSYSKEEIDEKVRLGNPLYHVSHGEVVLIDNKEYRVRVIGRYSDCAMFDPI